MRLLLLIIGLLVTQLANAQTWTNPAQTTLPPVTADGTENWLQDVTDQVDDLVTSHSDDLNELGEMMLAFFIAIRLYAAVSKFHHHHIHLYQELADVLVLSLFISLGMYYYSNPLPLSDVSLHQIPSVVGKMISGTFDVSLVRDFYARFGGVIEGLQKPHALDIAGGLTYFIVEVVSMGMDAILFTVNAWGFLALGIVTVFGKIFIPLLMTRNFKGKFFAWLDLLIGFAMYRAVASAMTMVWSGVIIRFFNHSVNGDYSLGHMGVLAATLVLLSAGAVYGLFKVPALTEKLFGGMGYAAEGFGNAMVSTVSRWLVA